MHSFVKNITMDFLKELKLEQDNKGVSTGSIWLQSSGEKIDSFSPVDGKLIASVKSVDKETYEAVLQKAEEAFLRWRLWPAPKRGDIVRQIGDALRESKLSLQYPTDDIAHTFYGPAVRCAS